MELGITAQTKRIINRTTKWDKYFPVPSNQDPILNGDVSAIDTARYMKKIVQETWQDTSKIAPLLKGSNLDETCSNIWHFIYEHINYALDKNGVEQLRRPARSWHDRVSGVDCDCYSIFAGSILYNLNIPFKFRITKYYGRDNFQHVYVVVPNGNGNYVIDPVIDHYNEEKEYSQKKDFTMDRLNGLNGIPLQFLNGINGDADIHDTMAVIMGNDLKGFGGLGSVQEDMDALRDYLIRTREVVSKNPALVATVTNGLSFVKMIDKALQYWNTSQRQQVLDQLAILEAKLEKTGNYKLSFKGIDELDNVGGFVVDKYFTGSEIEDPDYDYMYLEGRGAWSLDPNPELLEMEEYEYRTISGINGESREMRPRIRAYRPSLGGFFSKLKQGVKTAGKKVGNVAKKVAKTLVKFNPVSITVRLGIMAAMKVNMFKMADRLKYGYLTKEQATKLDMDLDEWEHAVKALRQTEKLFCDILQGKKDKLKNAILWGKRKKNFNERISEKEMDEIDNAKFDEKAIAANEEIKGLLGLGVVTAAAGGAAAAVSTPFLTKIWNFVKDIKIRGLFKRNPEKQALIDQYGKEEGKRRWKLLKSGGGEKNGSFVKEVYNETKSAIEESGSNTTSASTQEASESTSEISNENKPKGMIEALSNLSLGKKLLIGAGIVGGGILVMKALKKKKSRSSLSGVRRKKRTKKRKSSLSGLDGVKRRRRTHKSLPAKRTSTRKHKRTTRKTTRRRVGTIKLK